MMRSYFIIFFIILNAVLVSKNDNDDNYKKKFYICHNIKFKPKNIDCNNNNILYINLSFGAEGDNYYNTYI